MSSQYYIQKRVVKRTYDPSRPSINGHIKKMKIKNLGKMTFPEPVSVGDIIYVDGVAYAVKKKIFMQFGGNVILRVAEHSDISYHSRGNDCWDEEKPLFPAGYDFEKDLDLEKDVIYDGSKLAW